MNCATCKVKKIGPNTVPYGGYMCADGHLQCDQCNNKNDGQCGQCGGLTSFIQMNFNKSTAPPAVLLNAPSATQLVESSMDVIENKNLLNAPSSFVLPKYFGDIDTQSNISQEVLSIQESKEMLSDDSDSEMDRREYDLQEKPPMISQSFSRVHERPSTLMRNRSQMDTLFFSKNHHNSPYEKENSSKIIENIKSENVPDVGASNAKESFEDPNFIHASELRFMESTESLQNYFSGGTVPNFKQTNAQAKQEATPAATAATAATTATEAETTTTTPNTTTNPYQNLPNPSEGLSVNLVRDFEDKNTAHPTEIVENYLRNYGPLTVCHFPAYSFNHNCYHPTSIPTEGWMHMQVNSQTNVRSISVSTDSAPALCGTLQPKAPQNEAKTGKYPQLHPEFYVMQTTGVPQPAPGIIATNDEKMASQSIDLRLQKVLETFHEDPRQSKVSEKPLMETTTNYIKIPKPEPLSLAPDVSPPAMEHSSMSVLISEKITDSQDIANQLSQSHRAFYNPPKEQQIGVPGRQQRQEPPPQFQLISCSKLISNELLLAKMRFINMKPVPACELNIERSPIKCPESQCQRMIFVSDFNKHLVVDHNKLPMERIAPRQCKNFFLDARLSHTGTSKCHLLYLIRDKITDLGSSKFKDLLPLLVMTSRVKLADLLGGASHENVAFAKDDLDFLMIWLTGIVPDEFPISISLTVWPRSGQIPKCHVVHSGEVYSIRKSQNPIDVWRSGQMMLLSSHELNLLTNDGKEMLELQLVVH